MIECEVDTMYLKDHDWNHAAMLNGKVAAICPDETTARFLAACVNRVEGNNTIHEYSDARADFLAAREAQHND